MCVNARACTYCCAHCVYTVHTYVRDETVEEHISHCMSVYALVIILVINVPVLMSLVYIWDEFCYGCGDCGMLMEDLLCTFLVVCKHNCTCSA
jgi:hypothetical protein